MTYQYLNLEAKVTLRNNLRYFREKISDNTAKAIFGVDVDWNAVDTAIRRLTIEIAEEVR